MKNKLDKDCMILTSNMMYKKIILMSFLLFIFGGVMVKADLHENAVYHIEAQTAQQTGKKVTGQVSDNNGEPIVGASVVIKGKTTGVGAITDANGNFTLDNVPTGAVLVISYLGYNAQEVSVGRQSSVNEFFASQ